MLRDSNSKMALACTLVSLVGLLVMLVSNSIYEAPRTEINSITKEMAGERVVLCGVVKSNRDNGKDTVFLKLGSGNSSIDTVFFKDVKEQVSGLKAGSKICVEGNIQVYNGGLELVGRKLAGNMHE